MSKPAAKSRRSPVRTNRLVKPLAAVDIAAERIDEAQTHTQMLSRLVELRDAVQHALDQTVIAAHTSGSTWPMIAGKLKVSPQAVQQRVSRLRLNAG